MNCGLRAETIVYENKEMAKETRNREERNTRSSLALDTLIIFIGCTGEIFHADQ